MIDNVNLSDEFEQKIHGRKSRRFSIMELREKIINAETINNYYCDTKRASEPWIVNRTDEPIKGEEWLPCPHYPQYEASNYGRVRKIDGTIIKLKEENFSDAEINTEILGKPGIGWIQADNHYVYKLVADAWLDESTRPDECRIHHISNDGYDNRPENLIYLSRDAHVMVHKGVHSKEKYEPNFPW